MNLNALPDQIIQGTNRNKDFSGQDPLYFNYVHCSARRFQSKLLALLNFAGETGNNGFPKPNCTWLVDFFEIMYFHSSK